MKGVCSVMKSGHLFLLIYLTANQWDTSIAQTEDTCLVQQTCGQVPDSTSQFLQCVGLPPTDTGIDHIHRLKGLMEAAWDVYIFMKSSVAGVPVMSLEARAALNTGGEAFEDEDLVQMWMEIQFKPLLTSVTRNFLSCLSTKNFSCSTYQTVVKELSLHFSEMDPTRQKWIYMFFMYPFLAMEGRAGCAMPEEDSKDWLMKNFGSFRAMARVEHFDKLNMAFSGLEVLHLLSPEQKAQLLLRPEIAGLENGTLSMVFQSLMGDGNLQPASLPVGNNTWMTTGHPHSYSQDPYSPTTYYQPPPPQYNLREVLDGLMSAFRPVGSFVRDFVTLTHERNISEIRSTTLVQLLINTTLAELASNYKTPKEPIAPSEALVATEVEKWYEDVVLPLLQTFLPREKINNPFLQAVFRDVFYLDKDTEVVNRTMDVCSITLEEKTCGMTNMVENVAQVMHCVGSSNLTMSEETMMRLVAELTGQLNSMVKQFSTANFTEVAFDFGEVFQPEGSISPPEKLDDPAFITIWFQVKLLPLLPTVPESLLSCLSAKNFTCPAYQTLVRELSVHMRMMDVHSPQMDSHRIYQRLVYPFLLHHNASDPQCFTSTGKSTEWLAANFGFFSIFASLRDFYDLNANFAALETLELLSPNQTAGMLVLPLPTPPEKEVMVYKVFNYLTESPRQRRLTEVMSSLSQLVDEIRPPCSIYKPVFESLYQALTTVPSDIEPVIWATINNLMNTAPGDCLPDSVKCPVTPFNETRVCERINSDNLELYLNTSTSMDVECNFTLEEYACSSLKDFTASQLVSLLKCKLPGNSSSNSKETWKLLLTKLSSVLDPALDIIANMSMNISGPSASEVLDVIGEMRVFLLPDDQLRDGDVIRTWFSGRLRGFLSSASGGFLHCLSSRNLSCQSYQQVIMEFSQQFNTIDPMRRHLVTKFFIYPFLSRNSSDPACVSSFNNSAEWIQVNLGQFSVLFSLGQLQGLYKGFSPVEALQFLSPNQTAELLVLPIPAPEKEVIVNIVFDYLIESPEERRLPEVLHYLVLLVLETRPPCNVFKLISGRLYRVLPNVPSEIEPVIWTTISNLRNTAPMGCLPESAQCPYTPFNSSRICNGINSTNLQRSLNMSTSIDAPCNFTLAEYACASLKDFTANHLVSLLKCKLPGNSSSKSKETWKLLLTKLSSVLDPALDIIANMSMNISGPSASEVLDVIGEMRVFLLTDDQLRDGDVIRTWFSGRLRGFLSSASGGFLHCLSSRNLSCQSYQQVLKEFSYQFYRIESMRRELVFEYFILPFLSRNSSDPACVSNTNNSAEWIQMNLGQFSVLISLGQLQDLYKGFSPLDTLGLLSPNQTAELLVLPLPAPEKEVVINTVFDYLSESPIERRLTEVLRYVVVLVAKTGLPCVVYRSIFGRLYQALTTVPQDITPAIWATTVELAKTVPNGCVLTSVQCPVTVFNSSRVCNGLNSTELEKYLITSTSMEVPCNFTLKYYACSSLTDFTASQLVSLLECKLPGNSSSHSKETWKLLLTKLSSVLDPALDMLANKSTNLIGPSVSQVLDVIGELRISLLTDDQLRDSDVIRTWFSGRLRGFLSSASGGFLHCLSSRNLSCQSFQDILKEFSHQYQYMNDMTKESVANHFTRPILFQNSSDPGCVSNFNNSADWLQKNFGPFSGFFSLGELLGLYKNLSPLDTLELLTPQQSAELLVLPLPAPLERDVVVNRVFDYLIESPAQRGLPEFLSHLSMLSREFNVSCPVYQSIFKRLYQSMASLPSNIEPILWASVYNLSASVPVDCALAPADNQCPVSLNNATRVCVGVDSFDLQTYLDASNLTICNFSIPQYACSELKDFTATNLSFLLKCKLPENATYTRETWKLLFSKTSAVLDQALDMLSNQSFMATGPSVSQALDVIGELRLYRQGAQNWSDPNFIRTWFSGRLRGFLSSASGGFLHCLSSRNLSCQSFQQVVKEFGSQMVNLTSVKQQLVLSEMIVPFLSRPQTSPGCVENVNNNKEWLQMNVGPFSVLLSLRTLLNLNKQFSFLDVLELLSPNQMAEGLVLPHPTLENEIVIDTVFNFLVESPIKRRFPEFLQNLAMLSAKGNVTCSSYKTIFDKLDQATATVPLSIESSISITKTVLLQHIPQGCSVYDGVCNITPVNQSDICAGVNSTVLQNQLNMGTMSGMYCNFSIKEYACASSLSAMTAGNLADLLQCKLSGNFTVSKLAWKLFLSEASLVLDAALDQLSNTTFNPTGPAVPLVLGAIGEIRFDTFSEANVRNPAFILLWFNGRLRPFLSSVSVDFLSCLSSKNYSCTTYQTLVKILSDQQSNTDPSRQIAVYKHFIEVYLNRNNTEDPGCNAESQNSEDWLVKNFGRFSVFVSILDLQRLRPNFSAMDTLSRFSVKQLAQVSSTPGQLTTSAQVTTLMSYVPNKQFAAFFDNFSPAIAGRESLYPYVVRAAMLEQVFARANLSDSAVGDEEVLVWLRMRLRPLLLELSPSHVTPFFRLVEGRSCSIEQQAVVLLNSTLSTLSGNTSQEIYSHILRSLTGPSPLHCYGDRFNHSFYGFLEQTFLGFQFPNLSTFLSLMPDDRKYQLVNSMPPSDLGNFLRRPNIVDDEILLCQLYSTYTLTPLFLESEKLPTAVQRPTLTCVWPLAVSSSERSEVNAWFDLRLRDYLVLLPKSLLASSVTANASCMAFQKLVSVLGTHNYNSADFSKLDVYNVIRTYLRSATVPKCYKVNNPEYNSTAWFVEYVGSFASYLTLDDLNTFGSAQVLQIFTVNILNINLLQQYALPLNFTSYYTQLIYLQNSNFNPLLLPLSYRCDAPGPAFTQLTSEQSMVILNNLTSVCSSVDPQVFAALAGNMGSSINAGSLAVLGNASTGLSVGQLTAVTPGNLISSLSVLSTVNGWDQSQTTAIISSITSSGQFKINNSLSLITLGSLVTGIPVETYLSISGSEILTSSQNPSFVSYLATAPQIVQQTVVTQIISVNSSSQQVIQNVPDSLATEIPRNLLQGFSETTVVVTTLNKKRWKNEQAVLFFDTVAFGFDNSSDLSSDVLQGFTCTRVRTMTQVKVKSLVKACRRSGIRRVKLQETQLTCMYNYVSTAAGSTDFSLYPPDVLLYYDYSLVPLGSCRSYFTELGNADFSVISSSLNYRLPTLFTNARSCLGIQNVSLSRDNVEVLGNMCCTLDGSYIQMSDPLVLETLKNCPDFTSEQVAGMEALLLSGTTTYGIPSTWSRTTLDNLGILPLYLTANFYGNFDTATKRQYLRSILKVLRYNKVPRRKIAAMRKAIRNSVNIKSKRSVTADCTVGEITLVTISDAAFPFDYNLAQFNFCLDNQTVKNNLGAITSKVDQADYLSVVLEKLRQAYATLGAIPDEQVQVLGPASRQATVDDINLWNISTIDTLSALMDPSNGNWDPALAKAIITKYLSQSGKTLGTAELNSIAGPNLCALDANVLANVTPDSLSKTNVLVVTNCTLEKKQMLFSIAEKAFPATRSTVSTTNYQLIQPYLGGAGSAYIQALASSNISMDLATFTSLDPNVTQALSVNQVRDLLGSNLPQLKSYENQTVVQGWIASTLQSDLNTLNLGLTGGRADITATTSSSPTTGGSATTAASGGSATTAVSSGSATTAASGGSATTAASGGSVTTAASGGSAMTAVSSGSATTAASGGSATTAASGGSATTAASGGSATTAASGGSATTAVSSGSATTAASGGSATSAASGGSATSAASGGSATTAASGGSATTAASGGSATTAASGGSATTAASGGSATTAASGGSATTAASGGSAMTAASGGSATTAASGGSTTGSGGASIQPTFGFYLLLLVALSITGLRTIQ